MHTVLLHGANGSLPVYYQVMGRALAAMGFHVVVPRYYATYVHPRGLRDRLRAAVADRELGQGSVPAAVSHP